LFSPQRGRRPGPKGPKELIDAVVAMKRRNPRWGCPRIAQQIALAFGVEIDKLESNNNLDKCLRRAYSKVDDQVHARAVCFGSGKEMAEGLPDFE
jgi:hypothetical protein